MPADEGYSDEEEREAELCEMELTQRDVGVWLHVCGMYDGFAWRLFKNGKESENPCVTKRGARPLSYVQSWSLGGSPDAPVYLQVYLPPSPSPSPSPSRRSRSSAVMHVTPELKVLDSNPGGGQTHCPRR